MKKKPEIKHVWFDVGNVIVRASHEITHAILRDLGVAPDKAKLFFQCQSYLDFCRGKINDEQFARALRKLLNCRLHKDELQFAHDAHIYTIDDNVLTIMDALHDRFFPFCLVTNTNMWQTHRVENGFLQLSRWGSVYGSHGLGRLKTDPDFWPEVLSRAKITPEEKSSILFIDDGPANIAAAKAAGLQTYLYDTTYSQGAKKLRAMLKRRGLL